jgi:hypothetical protein
MTHVTFRSTLAGLALLLIGCLGARLPASAAPIQPTPGWSRLATVPPGTAIVVSLDDGRHLQRAFVTVDADRLTVADISRLRSSELRRTALQMIRDNPAGFRLSATFEEEGQRVQIVERFDRQSILAVERPGSNRRDPGILAWFFTGAGPCPNCDARQTILLGRTVLPSPLGASAATRRDVLYEVQPLRSGPLPHDLTWPRLREWPLAQKPDKKVALNVAGKWTMTLEMSMGTATPALDLKQDGEKIAGTYTGRYGSFDLQGSLKERAIQFSFTMSAEGQSVTMSFAGEVAADGQTMKGTATLGEMGDAAWSAKKDKSTP